MSTTHDDPVGDPRDHDLCSESTDGAIVSQTCGSPPEQLTLLDDEYACKILTVLRSGPRTGRELAKTTEFSRPTVYRRLNRLEDAGLVTSETRFDPEGNHCKEFALVRESLRVRIEDGGITVTATPTPTHK